ncbi:MAG: carboxypeptidase-like regulatory domain-containing protein [Bacteroidetes bacterium]|nr:carboxypeptidase-like regulatory domain-containing protein [Bacteroidota bacterium]
MNIRAFCFILFFVLVGITSTSNAQQTVVTGKIVDADTKEPLPFVSVLLKGTKVGTSSDFDGMFSLSSPDPSDSIVVSYVGYLRNSKKIKRNATQHIVIELRKNAISLSEVVIKPGENPAHRIIRKVIANKDNHNKEKLESYQYEVYNKMEIDLNNIPESYKKSRALKPVKFIFDYIDSTNEKEKPFLPVFLSESISDFYYNKDPRRKKEIIKASKITGLQDEKSVTQFMGEMYQTFNIYDNNITIFGKTFSSPISDFALLYYKFYLIDSVYIDGVRCYHIQFKQRRKLELVFEGNMWIADTSFSIKRIEMSLPKDINLNYINTLSFIQEYDQVSNQWMLTKDRIILDFSLQKKQVGFYGRKTTSYKNIIINKPQDELFYKISENLIVDENANKKTDDFWKVARHDTLSKNEAQVYKMVDTIQSLPIYKTWENMVVLFLTGYKVWGPIEIGPYYKMLSSNNIEGWRARIGGRTSNTFSKWVELNGYTAYGFKDEEFKYFAEFKTFVTKKPRQIAYLNYKNDYEILGQSWNAFTPDNILSSIFRRNPIRNMNRVEQFQFIYEYEPFAGWNNKVYFINRSITSLGNNYFKYFTPNPEHRLDSTNKIRTSEIRLLTRFAYNEKYLEGTFTRSSMGTKYPIVSVAATFGLKNVWKGQYEYQKYVVNVNDRFYLGGFGYVDCIVEAGKIFGTVPFPLLELHGGNETYVYDPYAFNMMNFYEFASDRYFTSQAFYHLDGFFLNKVPLFRRLKWREVVSGKMLMGDVSLKNKDVLLFPNTLAELNRGPYYELGLGIENIFKFFRLDMMWRMSYKDDQYIERYNKYTTESKISKFGLRGTIQIIL